MKKYITIATLLAAGTAFANAATELLYWGGNNGKDLLTVSGGYTPYLALNSNRASETILSTLKTLNDATYDLTFDPSRDSNVATPNFALNDAIYLNTLTISGTTLPTSFTIDFGTAGSITTVNELNFGSSVTAFSFSAAMSDEQLETLNSGKGEVVTRDLLVGNGNWGIWNFSDKGTKTFTVSNLSGYTFKGSVTSADELGYNEYGYIYSEGGAKASADKVSLVVKGAIPEPSAFGLLAGLGALALVGTRRRRR